MRGGWELSRRTDKRSDHLCAAVDELRRFDRPTPILVRQYTRLRTGDAPGTSCVTAQNCDGACADSPRCVRRPPSRGSVRRRELRHDPVARAKLAPSRTRSAGCPPKTAERQMRSLSGQSTCAALAGVSLRTHRRRLSDAGGRTADGVPSSVQRFGGGGGGDGGQAAAASAVAAQIVTRSTPRRAPAGRSGCGGDGESAPDRKATARRERMRGAEEAGASKAQRLRCAALAALKSAPESRVHNRIVARVCVGTSCILHSFFVLVRVTGTGDKSVDCVSFIAT